MALLSGCAAISPQPEFDSLKSRAFTPEQTQTYKDLTSLPKPRGVLRAAVYSFRDATGQYKPQPSNGLSTAVTQGADAILIKALLDSNWFAPVERSNLQNLLTERKILQSSILDETDEEPDLESVAPAEVIIEGNIVSYDFNTQTGGAGLRLLGLGGSSAHREDRVTVSMRLIDIDDGLILHNVVNTKRIFSRKLDSGIFSYIDSDELLEAEAGFSHNEPSHIAVTEAIESALINMIAEGIVSGTLQLDDAEEVNSGVFDRFLTDNQKTTFLDETKLAIAKREEQERFNEAIRTRMEGGIASLNSYATELQEERNKKARKERLRRLAKNETTATQQVIANNANTSASQKPVATQVATKVATARNQNGLVRQVANQTQTLNRRLITSPAQQVLQHYRLLSALLPSSPRPY